MIKFTILLKRNAKLSQEEFVEYHRTRHAPLFTSIGAVKTHVRRYVQQHALPIAMPGLPPAKYDGVTELWFDDAEGVGAVFTDPEYLAVIRPDEEKFLDLQGCDFILSQETPILG